MPCSPPRPKAKSPSATCSTVAPASSGWPCSAPALRRSPRSEPTRRSKPDDTLAFPHRGSLMKTKTFASRTDRLQAMNQALDRELARLSQGVGSSQSSLLTEMVQYHLGLRKAAERPGKRLRANIALLTCEAFGKRYAEIG